MSCLGFLRLFQHGRCLEDQVQAIYYCAQCGLAHVQSKLGLRDEETQLGRLPLLLLLLPPFQDNLLLQDTGYHLLPSWKLPRDRRLSAIKATAQRTLGRLGYNHTDWVHAGST